MEPLDVGDASDAPLPHLAAASEEKPGPSFPLAVEDGDDEKREVKSHPMDGTEFPERDEGVEVAADGAEDPEQRIYETAAGDAAAADGFEEGDVGAAMDEAKGSIEEDDEEGDCDVDGGGEKAPILAPFSLDDLDFVSIEVDDVVICEKAAADDSDEAIGGDAADGEAMGEEAGADADDVLSEEAGADADADADDVLREEAAGDADADDVLKEEVPADSDYVLGAAAAAAGSADNLLREEATADDDAEDVSREEAAAGDDDDVFREEAAAVDAEDVLREEAPADADDDKLSRDKAAANDDDAEDVSREEAAADDAEDVLREEAAAADDNDDDDDVVREEADNDEVAVEEPATEFMDEEDSEMATEEAMHDALQETEPVMDAQRGGGGKRKRGRPSSVEEMEEEQEEAPVFEPSGGEETRMASEEEEPMAETASGSSGKRKRGRPPKSQVAKVIPRRMAKSQVARAPVKRKEEEEVCFICFDGGDLVVCDRRGCPKVYHPACVNRDESFFRSKGRWNCGWHICSLCQKSAHFMCYTCTYSLCKGCIKEAAGFICVRGNKGLCETCLSTVMLIEKDDHVAVGVDFDDRNSWMHMFKEYWLQLKGKLSLTFEELDMARTSRKGSNVSVHNVESSDELYNAENDHGASSDSSLGRRGGKLSSRKKMKKHSRRSTNEASVKVGKAVTSAPEDIEWASKELLELVTHMRDGDRSLLSQFDVQNLLLDYIKRNNLRDPRRKSHIICDPMLQNLFGKPRVGHFEMLKLLESHFLVKESSQLVTDDSQGGVVDPDSSQVDAERNSDASTKMSSDKKRKTRKRFERELQYNLDDYAAIDVHNINLMYLRRNLMEDLIDDVEGFYEKVVGSFVRIRISGSGQRQDMYRLVQVTGTRNAAEKYKTGKKMTDILLEILNLNKTEVITIDIISNQEFTEEECKRLRQSIKCGLIGRLTVGEVQEKAMLLQAVRVNDWLENEKSRLGHLRDRASEQGRRKQLRECVEKLQLLSTPEERIRRLNEVPEIHADPNMDPDYESAEDEVEPDDKKGESYDKQIEASSFKKGMEVTSPGKGGSFQSNSSNNLRKSLNRNTVAEGTRDRFDSFIQGDGKNGTSPSQGKDVFQVNAAGLEASVWNAGQPGTKPAESSGIPQTTSAPATGVTLPSSVSETEKIWHYQDPSGKIQGPFSMTQLRKWDTTGYFPPTLKIWRASESQEVSILLADALIGKFQSYLPQPEPQHHSFPQSTNTSTMIGSRQNNSDGSHRENNWRGNNISTFTESGLSGGTWNGQNNVGISAWSSDGKDCSDVKAGSYTQAWSPISAPRQEPHSISLHSAPGVSAWQENQPQKLESSLPGAEHVKSGNQEVVSHIDSERSMPSPTPSANPTPAANLSGLDGGIISDFNQNSQFHSSHSSRSLASSEERVSASTEPAPQPNSGWGLVPQNVNSVTVQAQGNGNLGWGSAVQANASAGWGTVVPGNTNVAWGIPAQGNANVNLGFAAPAQANSTVNPGWTAPAQGNTNVNMGWVAPTQGNMSEQVNTTLNPNWGALPQGNLKPASGNMPQNINWAASVQTAANANPGWGTRQANINQPWDPSAGNHNGWNSQHPQKEDGNSFQGERSFHGNDSGHGSGRHSWNRMHSSGGGSSWTPRGGQTGVCRFHESGYCKKGANCNYVHL